MLSVCVSATSTQQGAITTSAALRLVLGATSTANDVYQQALVARATRWAESFLGYPLHVQTYTETLAGFGGRNLMLARTPIRVILRAFDSTSTATATELCSTDFRLEDPEAGFLSRDRGWGWTAKVDWGMAAMILPGDESHPWMVSYSAGYVGANGMSTDSVHWTTCGGSTSTGQTLPFDLEHGILLRASELASVQPPGVQSEAVGDLKVTYFGREDYRSEAEDLLGPYRRSGG